MKKLFEVYRHGNNFQEIFVSGVYRVRLTVRENNFGVYVDGRVVEVALWGNGRWNELFSYNFTDDVHDVVEEVVQKVIMFIDA